MAVARRSNVGTVASAVNGTSVVVPKPTDAEDGDLIVVFFAFNQASINLTTPDDSWSQVLRQSTASAGGITTHLAWAKVRSTDGSSYTFTSSATGGFTAVSVCCYSTVGEDVNIYKPLYLLAGVGTSCASASITTDTDNDLVLSSFVVDLAGADNWVASSPGSLAELADIEDHTNMSHGVFEETRGTAGAGAHTATKTDATLGANTSIVAVKETGKVLLHGTYRNVGIGTVTSGTFVLPDRFKTGDVAICVWYTRDSTKTFTEDANVTQLYDSSSAGFGRLFIGYRWLTAGDADPTWSSSSVANSDTFWFVMIFRNVKPGSGNPFEAESGAPATWSNAIQPDPPAATAIGTKALALTIFGKNNDSVDAPPIGAVSVPPSGYFTIDYHSATAGTDASAGIAGKKVNAGSENPGAWSLAGGAATDDGYVWTGILAPFTSYPPKAPNMLLRL